MSEQIQVSVGDIVRFIGFAGEDLPDNAEHLTEGEDYEVVAIVPEEGDNLGYVGVAVPNPAFNAKKPESAKNPATLTVDLFEDEYEVLEEDGVEGGEQEAADGAQAAGDEPAGEEIELNDAKVGDTVTVVDTEQGEYTGVVSKRTRTGLTILVEGEGEEDEEVVYKASEIATIYLIEEEQAEPEPEPEPAPAAKTASKKGAAKAAAAPTLKGSAPKAAKTGLKSGEKVAAPKAAKEPKAPKEEEDEDLKNLIPLTDEEQDQDVLGLVQEAEGDEALVELARELEDDAAHKEFQLGGVLYNLRRSKAFRRIKEGVYNVKGGFQAFLDAEFQIGYRKAMYLIEIYQAFSAYGVPAQKVTEIGWSKAKAIAAVMDDKNKDELLEHAESSTYADLNDTIKESYSKKGSDTREKVLKTTFKFRLNQDEGKTVLSYLEQAAKQLGVKDISMAFSQIVTEWGIQNLNVAPRIEAEKAIAAEKTPTKATPKVAARTAKAAPVAQATPAKTARTARR